MSAGFVASAAGLASASVAFEGAGFEGLAAEWEALAERTSAAPYLRPGWVGAWWRAFGTGRLELRIVRRGGRLAALLPLGLRGGVQSSPTNWHSPEFGWLADSAEAATVLLDGLFASRPRRLALAFLASEPARLAEERARAHGYRVIRRTQQESPFVPIASDWETYRLGLRKNLRSNLTRRRKLLDARGASLVEVSSGEPRERLEELLAEGFEIEAAGWKGKQGTAIASGAAYRRFYTEVARWAAARGWLRLAFLRLDGRALAFDYCLEYGDVHAMLKTGYDPGFAELSPGLLLREAMIERAFRAGLASYEFLGGVEPWKLQWAEHRRPRELLQSFRPSPLGLVDWTLFQYGRPLAKRLRARVRSG